MNAPTVVSTQKTKKAAPVRAASAAAAKDLGQGGALLALALSWLFCLVVVFTVYLLAAVSADLLTRFAPALPSAAVNGICAALAALLALFFALPLFVGRLRMAGLIAAGESVLPKAVFHCFTSPAAYRRGLALGLVYLVSLALPIAPVTGAFIGTFALYRNLFSARFSAGVAAALLILLLLACAALAFLLLFLSGFWFGAAALAAGNAEWPVSRAIRVSFAGGWRRCGTVFFFLLDRAARLLLSLLTVGGLWVLYYAHHTTLAYWHLSFALYREKTEEKSEI